MEQVCDISFFGSLLLNTFQAHIEMPASSSSRAVALMNVDTSDVARELDERKDWKRAQWRAGVERERERVQGREREVAGSYSSSYTEVVACWRGRGMVGAVGDGRDGVVGGRVDGVGAEVPAQDTGSR